MNKKVNIEVSARHIHLKKEDFEELFGKGAELTVMKELSQPGMFAANEIVRVKNEHFEIEKMRLVGPLRLYTQIEISETEARKFKINPPLRRSGDVKDTPGITIIGPKGQIEIKNGVIIAKRHVHMTPKDAEEIKVKDGDLLKVKTEGDRGLVFEHVVARVDETYAWAMHIDTDEGNASIIPGCKEGKITVGKEIKKMGIKRNLILCLIILILFILGVSVGVIINDSQWREEIENNSLQNNTVNEVPTLKQDNSDFKEWKMPTIPKKPVIYLYPQEKQDVYVNLDYNGEFIATYPDYDYIINGWNVTAYPDGKLINHADGREYNYLFWEGESYDEIEYDFSKGFVVAGKDTVEFLQKKLSTLGLTPKEYNEFIVYWYPKMKDNKFNYVYFAGSEYTDTAVLKISPEPDSILRVFMAFKSLSEKLEVQPQELKSFERKGFSVIEWGGTEI